MNIHDTFKMAWAEKMHQKTQTTKKALPVYVKCKTEIDSN